MTLDKCSIYVPESIATSYSFKLEVDTTGRNPEGYRYVHYEETYTFPDSYDYKIIVLHPKPEAVSLTLDIYFNTANETCVKTDVGDVNILIIDANGTEHTATLNYANNYETTIHNINVIENNPIYLFFSGDNIVEADYTLYGIQNATLQYCLDTIRYYNLTLHFVNESLAVINTECWAKVKDMSNRVWGERATTTGELTFTNLLSKRYLVSYGCDGYADGVRAVVLTQNLDVYLTLNKSVPRHILQVKVKNARGEYLGGVNVKVYKNDTIVSECETDVTGLCSFELEQGTYRVYASTGLSWAEEVITLDSDKLLELTLVTDETKSLVQFLLHSNYYDRFVVDVFKDNKHVATIETEKEQKSKEIVVDRGVEYEYHVYTENRAKKLDEFTYTCYIANCVIERTYDLSEKEQFFESISMQIWSLFYIVIILFFLHVVNSLVR